MGQMVWTDAEFERVVRFCNRSNDRIAHFDLTIHTIRVKNVQGRAANKRGRKQSAGEGFEPCHHAQKGGLAAARRANVHDELAIRDPDTSR